jgi:hypothetical protein
MHGLETIIAMNERAPGQLYRTKKDGWSGGRVVVRISDDKPVFYGTRSECADWIERNGHDGDV